MDKTLDLITIGRSSVDLYGAQVGGRLEDMGSFDKYIGGSPTNIACGTARLGLKSAVITGVGDEHMGRFIREQLEREGVDTTGVKTDPDRLTALVLLGIRDQDQFPLIFYRENCADMGLSSFRVAHTSWDARRRNSSITSSRIFCSSGPMPSKLTPNTKPPRLEGWLHRTVAGRRTWVATRPMRTSTAIAAPAAGPSTSAWMRAPPRLRSVRKPAMRSSPTT